MGGEQPVIIWLNAVLMALTLGAICSRVGRRVFLVGTWSWHDVLISVAAISACLFSILQIVGAKYGLGLHKEEVSDSNMVTIVKLVITSNVFYFGCNWAVKHALLLFYSDITRDNKYHKWSIYIMHFVAFGFGSSSILANIFQCRPMRKTWDSDVPGWCARMDIFFYINSGIMLSTDIVLYVMPVVFTWNLQLRRSQKIGLNCLFALGGFVLTMSAVRVWSVHKFNTMNDFSWWFANAMIWSVLENHLAIVVACAPSMKVIALLLFPKFTSSYRRALSKISPSSSRSRSRASHPFDLAGDLESGTRKSGRSDRSGKTDDGYNADAGELKDMKISTPLPSPAYTGTTLGSSRASRNFAKWFRSPSSPTSPRGLTSADSLEETGLVYVEEAHNQKGTDVVLKSIPKGGRQSMAPTPASTPTPHGENDIRVEHTISVESASHQGSSEDDAKVVGKAV